MPRMFVGSLTLSLTLIALTAAPASASVRCVNPGGTGGCFATIQSAIFAASNFDTIDIAPGTYHEKVDLRFSPYNKSLTIQGAGPEVTIIDGTGLPGNFGTSPVLQFQFDPPVGPTVLVQNLTLMGGHRGVDAGRGVQLTLKNIVVRNNGPGSGAGVFNNSSHVTIIDSTIRDNFANDNFFGCDASGGTAGGIAKMCGGGFYEIINTSVINNTAREAGGGAVFVNADVHITNSTFSGNRVLSPTGISAAIMDFAENMYMHNVTIADNTVPNPGGGAVGMFSLTNEMKGVLLQRNTGGNCYTNFGGQEPIDSLGYNVSDDAGCVLTGPGDLENTSANLGPLADNGGPTPTHALSPGPGLNAIPNALCPDPATDQRGVSRPQSLSCDSGSFEAVDTSAPVVTVPGTITRNATSPQGATVTFNSSADDAFDGAVAVTCVPASGSTFAAGTTTVTCSASDVSGNDGSSSFDVVVVGAQGQLQALLALINAADPGSNNLQALTQTVVTALNNGKPDHACHALGVLKAAVDRMAGQNKPKLTAAQASAINAAIANLQATIGCQ